MARKPDVFDKILYDGIRRKKIPELTQKARKWYRSKGKRSGVTRESFEKSLAARRKKNTIQFGKMYFFDYSNPKWKKELPYYDAFPLIFPFNYQNGKIYAINLHHAPFKYRALIMDSLYAIRNNDRFDETTKLRMSWPILKRITKFKEVKPIVRSYFPDRVGSHFIEVEPSEWSIALFLPVADYKKKSRGEIFQDYRDKISK